MKDIPVIELKVRALGEDFHGMIASHSEEIKKQITAGFDRAAETVSDTIVKMAATEAQAAFEKEVREYFSWGKGRDAIREAVRVALEPVATAMSGKQ